MSNKWACRLSTALLWAQGTLILLSWLLAAGMNFGARSLLSGEGLRAFVGGFTATMMHPLLVYLLMAAAMVGTWRESGLCDKAPRKQWRHRMAMTWAAAALAVYAAVCLWLVIGPEGVLLSAEGRLWPSPFSRGLVPMMVGGATLFAAVYGALAGHFSSLGELTAAWIKGITACAPWLLCLMLALQLLASARFVFSL